MAIYPYIYIYYYTFTITGTAPTSIPPYSTNTEPSTGSYCSGVIINGSWGLGVKVAAESGWWQEASAWGPLLSITHVTSNFINFLLLESYESYQISIPLGFIKLNLHFQCYLVPNGPSHFRHVTHPEGRWESARWVSLSKCCLPWSQLGIFEPWILLIRRKYGDLSSKIGWFNGIERGRMNGNFVVILEDVKGDPWVIGPVLVLVEWYLFLGNDHPFLSYFAVNYRIPGFWHVS